jgi:O-antigen/teichoic acid export membrane protein
MEAAAGSQALSGLVSLFYILGLPKSRMRLHRLRKALRFAVPFVPHFVAQWVLGAADLWILGKAGFEEELGSYSLAVQVVVPVSMVVMAWNQHMGPEMGERFRAGGVPEIRANLSRVRLSYLAAAAIPGAALLLGLPVIVWLIGAEFEPAIIFVPFLLLALLPDTLYFSDFQIVYFSGRTKSIGGATVTAACVNVALGLALIPPFGALGAVGARVARTLARSLIIVHIARGTDDDAVA